MRPKVLLVFLLVAGVVLGGLALLTKRLFPLTTAPVAGTDADSSLAPAVRSNAARANFRRGDPQVKPGLPSPPAAEPTSSNADSSTAILAELEDPHKEIRRAALDKIIELDDRSVIPQLRAIADRTADLSEKINILKAIEFMSLPSVEEHLAAEKARRAALGLPEPTPVLTNRFTGRRRSRQMPAPQQP